MLIPSWQKVGKHFFLLLVIFLATDVFSGWPLLSERVNEAQAIIRNLSEWIDEPEAIIRNPGRAV